LVLALPENNNNSVLTDDAEAARRTAVCTSQRKQLATSRTKGIQKKVHEVQMTVMNNNCRRKHTSLNMAWV